MLVDLKPKFYLDLLSLLEKMERDADKHYMLTDEQNLIESWTPSSDGDGLVYESIDTELTVGDLRLAKKLKADLLVGAEIIDCTTTISKNRKEELEKLFEVRDFNVGYTVQNHKIVQNHKQDWESYDQAKTKFFKF